MSEATALPFLPLPWCSRACFIIISFCLSFRVQGLAERAPTFWHRIQNQFQLLVKTNFPILSWIFGRYRSFPGFRSCSFQKSWATKTDFVSEKHFEIVRFHFPGEGSPPQSTGLMMVCGRGFDSRLRPFFSRKFVPQPGTALCI